MSDIDLEGNFMHWLAMEPFMWLRLMFFELIDHDQQSREEDSSVWCSTKKGQQLLDLGLLTQANPLEQHRILTEEILLHYNLTWRHTRKWIPAPQNFSLP